MRKSDIVNAIMSSFTNVQDVEVSERPGFVTIVVTTDLRNSAEQYNLRVNIMTLLEKMRPMGVGTDVQLKSYDDGSLLIFREQTVPTRNIEYTYNINEREDVFEADFDDDDMPEQVVTLSRFSAVAAEITEAIAPLMKSTSEPRPTVPRLFEQTIQAAYGKPSACPKCGCFAFEPNASGDRAVCRGCPLPSPSYPIEYADKDKLTTRRYKCSSCNRDSAVTMELREVNLYCSGCGKLSIHSVQVSKSRVLRGSKAIMTFKDVKIEGFAENVEVVEFDPLDLYKEKVDLNTDKITVLPPGKSYDISFEVESASSSDDLVEALARSVKKPEKGWPTPSWAAAIAQLQQRVAGEFGMPEEALNDSPALQLVEMFRVKLGLRPFSAFAEERRNENLVSMDSTQEKDFNRRTGRTTRRMLLSIAEFMVNADLRMLAVVGATARYTNDLAKEARRMYEQLNLSRKMDIKPLMPSDFDPRFDYTATQRTHVFVDHSYTEKLSRYV